VSGDEAVAVVRLWRELSWQTPALAPWPPPCCTPGVGVKHHHQGRQEEISEEGMTNHLCTDPVEPPKSPQGAQHLGTAVVRSSRNI